MTTTRRFRHLVAAGVGIAALGVAGVSCTKDATKTSTTTTAPGASSSTSAPAGSGANSGGDSGSTSNGGGSTPDGGSSTTGSTMAPPTGGGGTGPRGSDAGVGGVGGIVTEPPAPTATVRPGSADPNVVGGATANGN